MEQAGSTGFSSEIVAARPVVTGNSTQGRLAGPLSARMPFPEPANVTPKNLVGLTREEMAEALLEAGTSERQIRMRVAQVWQWIYQKGRRDFDSMTNLAKDYRRLLSHSFTICVPSLVEKRVSGDGTRKYLFRIEGRHEIETVYIPDVDRGTLCISSQVGCTLNCRFCHTGTQALVRNLSVSEIVGQILAARDDLGEWPDLRSKAGTGARQISNIVLMGMGEPLYNFENVRDAMKIAMDGEGIGISRRRITLSTAGVVPGIARVGKEINCRLAISLHATTDEVRDRLVPINRKWNIAALFEELHRYPRLGNSDRVTFEYVMLKGVNDSDEDARRLVRLVKGLPCKVNLIPFNAWPGAPYERSESERINAFSEIVFKAGYSAPVRRPRGEDIMAACGQLKSATQRTRKKKADRVQCAD